MYPIIWLVLAERFRQSAYAAVRLIEAHFNASDAAHDCTSLRRFDPASIDNNEQ